MSGRSDRVLIPLDESLPRTRSYGDGVAVLRSHDFGSGIYEENWDILGGTLLGSDGERHKHLKRVEAALFAPSFLKHYEEEILAPVVRSELQAVLETCPPDEPARADLVSLGRRMTLQISARVVGLDTQTPPAIRRLSEILAGLADAILIQWCNRDPEVVMAEAREHKSAYWEEFVQPALNERRRAAAVGLPPSKDLLSLIVADVETGWTDDEILKECILYLAAASFTTATAVTHTVAELDGWLRSHPEDRARLQDFGFLRAAAMESLRVHPGRHVLLRTAVCPASLPDGTQVDTRDVVLVDCFEANMDGDAYGVDVALFNPHRSVAGDASAYGLSFGAGRHVCLGRPLVLGTDPDRGNERRHGTLALLLHGLYQTGLEVDPERSPRRPDSAHDRYDEFPVIFSDNRR